MPKDASREIVAPSQGRMQMCLLLVFTMGAGCGGEQASSGLESGSENGGAMPTACGTAPGAAPNSDVAPAEAVGPIPPESWPWQTDAEFARRRQDAINRIGLGRVYFALDAVAWWNHPTVLPERSSAPHSDAYGDTRLISAIRFSEGHAPGAPAEDEGVPIPPYVDEVVSVEHQVDDEFLASTLPYVPETKALALSYTLITDQGLASIAHLPYLESLQLRYGWTHRYPVLITDEGVKAIASHPRLRRLLVSGMPITDRGIGYLAHNRTIEWLAIYGCPITPDCFISLATMPNLRDLSIGWNRDVVVTESYRPDFSRPISDEVAKAIASMEGRLRSLTILGLNVHPSFLEAVMKIDCLPKHYLGPDVLYPSQKHRNTGQP